MLEGNNLETWEFVCTKDFSKADDEATGNQTTGNWLKARDRHVKRLFGVKNMRDIQWRGMRDGGFRKPVEISPYDQSRRFSTSLRISKMMPQGIIPDPTANQIKAWYFMSFRNEYRLNYVRSWKDLSTLR